MKHVEHGKNVPTYSYICGPWINILVRTHVTELLMSRERIEDLRVIQLCFLIELEKT